MIQDQTLQYPGQSGRPTQYNNSAIIETFRAYILKDDINGLKKYSKQVLGFDASKTGSYIQQALKNESSDKFLLQYVDSLDEGEFAYADLADSNWTISSGKLQVGDISSFDQQANSDLQAALNGNQVGDKFKGNNLVSINPDELDGHALIHTFPAVENPSDSKIPAMMQTADGYQFGYIDKTDGRFYLTVDDIAVKKDGSTHYIGISDMQTPDVGMGKPDPGMKSMSGVPGVAALSNYQYAYSNNSSGAESMGDPGHSKSVSSHWEKMMIDTSYRDISGRMLRAFPTYMLWLISESNFAGTKLFDNFYGLQSIIDFSIVSSEDLLGDTLVFKASNMYAKLSTKEATTLFSGPGETSAPPGTDILSLSSGLESVIDQTLNRARNLLGHMESQYVVDIENIRLKPGVRVHLRSGYGSNPNALHTLFNGVITEVELGEIVTVTCQSDAIELSPMVNSTDKKGDSGHIDGGLNTGLYLSEPRDLMVRLLSMGTSRTREAFAQSTRGLVFSQNKFGIKHFGTILYEPLNEIEYNRNAGMRNAISDAALAMGGGSGYTQGMGAPFNAFNPFGDNKNGTGISLGADVRLPIVGTMRTMWANFSAQRDIELFKRNIYPGNGTGIAQFMGGDIGDGWQNAASLTPEDMPNKRLDYLNRLTDSSWNDLLQKYDTGSAAASSALDTLTQGMGVNQSGGTASTLLGGGLLAAGTALAIGTGGMALPVIGGVLALGGGASLLGSLSGRGGVNIWKTFGLVSDLDDDMPGFDEVSFRAQTYMKSIWDLFQTCARLLPNYIVAVRPFEDRSTIFYGKPHWLYTSGVVPITTGFPSEDKAVRLGLKRPSYRSPDAELMNLLNTVNKNSNPTADYDAFRNAANPSISLETIIKEQSAFADVYAPAGILRGKVINLTDPGRLFYQDSNKKNISEIPQNRGYVTVGFHLPIDPTGTSSESEIDGTITLHKEIPQMPLRFSFPFFTDRAASAPLLDYSFYALSNNRSTDKGALDSEDKDVKKLGKDILYTNLLEKEASMLSGTNLIDVPEGAKNDEFSINLSAVSFTSQFDTIANFGSENFIFDISKTGTSGKKTIIRMPLPIISKTQFPAGIAGKVEGSWEYEYVNQNLFTEKTLFSYRDWGSPATALDEQFYIAMRWPYDINKDNNADPSMLKKFKSTYFPDRDDDEFYGTPKDYKNRKVLVYSPLTRTAVVCKPAYFMWGDDNADLITSGLEINRTDTNFVNYKNPNFRNIQDGNLAAVISPDAAYYLGVMHLTETEKEYFNSDEEGNKSVVALAGVNLAPAPMPRDCYFVFVDDSIPVGVVTTLYNPAQDFTYQDTDGENGKGKYIGFGKFQSPKDASTSLTAIEAGLAGQQNLHGSADRMEQQIESLGERPTALSTQWKEYLPTGGITLLDAGFFAESAARGGNLLASDGGKGEDSYFDLIIKGDYNDALSKETLYAILDKELITTGDDEKTGTGRVQFAAVYDPASEESVQARSFYDEGFSNTTHVIAGNGRTLAQASDVWDQFRMGYHDYDSVKKIFFDAFGLDPEDVTPLPDFILQIIKNPKANIEIFKSFGSNGEKGANDEFSLLLGSDFTDTSYSKINTLGRRYRRFAREKSSFK